MEENNVYWLTFVLFPLILIVGINLLLSFLVPKLKYMFSTFPLLITIYFFIKFQDSSHSMEGIYEFFWGVTAFGVGVISFFVTKLFIRKSFLS